jgi:hypothetical protein
MINRDIFYAKSCKVPCGFPFLLLRCMHIYLCTPPPPTKTKPRACPTWTPAPNTHARFATSRPRTRGGEQRKIERSRTHLGRREWAAQQRATGPLVASPRPRSLGCGGAAGMPLRERFAHGQGNGHA